MPRFPSSRPRRLRRTDAMRRLVAETTLGTGDLVAPLFVKEGITDPQVIPSMPGHNQHTLESLRKEVVEIAGLGIPGVILFGIPVEKAAVGTQADREDGIVQRALREMRAEVGSALVLIADLCHDEHPGHG